MPPDREVVSLLIVGGSTRAAAQSALRAGLRPVCADLFGDADLRRIAEVLPVTGYPQGLIAAAELAPPGPWIYTGGLENHPRIVARIARRRPLWGNAAETLLRVRNPFTVAGLLEKHQFPCLPVRPDIEPPPPDGRWMRKPRRGSAGRGIEVWDASASQAPQCSEPVYFQLRQPGVPISALFLAAPDGVRPIGIARQLIGLSEVGADPYAFCGSIVPLPVSDRTRSLVQRIGVMLGEACGLRGLFGCDFLLVDDVPWLTEVNPRYTASTELFERHAGVPLLDAHRRACLAYEMRGAKHLIADLDARFAGCDAMNLRGSECAGKVIVYADVPFNAPDLEGWDGIDPPGAGWLSCADIPVAGTRIGRGEPICSLFAGGADVAACESELLERARRLRASLRVFEEGRVEHVSIIQDP